MPDPVLNPSHDVRLSSQPTCEAISLLMLQTGKLRSREGTCLASGLTASKMKDSELNHRFVPSRVEAGVREVSSQDKTFRGQDKDWGVSS